MTLLALWGCVPSSPFTERELDRLRHLRLVDDPPPAVDHDWADDLGARAFGEQLFHDPELSGPLSVASALGGVGDAGRVACATCHDLDDGGADSRGTATSLGAGWGKRNAPSVLNVGYRLRWSWGGERATLAEQSLYPLVGSAPAMNSSEIGLACLMVDKYSAWIRSVFGKTPRRIDEDCALPVADANARWDDLSDAQKAPIDAVLAYPAWGLEAYLRGLRSCDSPFDRMICDGDPDAMTAEAIEGARLFVGRAECIQCHWNGTINDGELHTIGIPTEDPGPCPLGEEDCEDYGRFQTPSLRNVARTAPYMHDGSFESLEEVLWFYREGGADSGFPGHRDPLIGPLDLTDQDVAWLVAFLESLTTDGDQPCPRECVE